MKKLMAVIMILVIMVNVGVVAFATNEEEDPKDLIGALVEEGFIYDEYEDVWMYVEYTFYGDGEYEYIHGWYDVEENIGVMFVVDYNKFGIVDECSSGAIRWNSYTCDMEVLGEFEWSI